MIRAIRETCSGKTRYADKRTAQTALNANHHRSRNRKRQKLMHRLRSYYCDRCNGWHLTKQEDRNA